MNQKSIDSSNKGKMPKKVRTTILMFGFIFCLSTCLTKGQVPIPLDSLIANSPYIFEGTVIKDTAFYGQTNGWIYTAHTLKITKVFKGEVNCGNAEMVTVGGTIDSITGFVEGALKMNIGAQGIFMCIPSQWPTVNAPIENPIAFSAYADIESVFAYDTKDTSDHAVVIYANRAVNNFPSHEAAYQYFQNNLGHGYTNCGPPEDDLATDFSYYPNPVSGPLHFSVPGSCPASVYLFDITGKMVLSYTPATDAWSSLKLNGLQPKVLEQIDLTRLRSGMYIAKVVTPDKSYTIKLLKL